MQLVWNMISKYFQKTYFAVQSLGWKNVANPKVICHSQCEMGRWSISQGLVHVVCEWPPSLTLFIQIIADITQKRDDCNSTTWGMVQNISWLVWNIDMLVRLNKLKVEKYFVVGYRLV